MSVFEFQYDDHEIQNYLERFKEPAVRRLLMKSRSAAGRAGAPILKASYQGTSHPYSTTGNLENAIGYAAIKSNPAIGVVIAALRRRGRLQKSTGKRIGQKRGAARHLLEYGTKPHLIPARKGALGALAIAVGVSHYIHHPGGKAKPFLGPAVSAIGNAASAAAERVIQAALE